MDIEALVHRFPRLKYLKSPAFKSLPLERQKFFLDCVEDAVFWIDLEKQPHPSDGFKFLAATYGLHKAEEKAHAQGLEGKERIKFLKEAQNLYTLFNPFGNPKDQE